MKLFCILSLLTMLVFASPQSISQEKQTSIAVATNTWEPGSDVEEFWRAYVESKGGLTWPESSDYPLYEKVNEGDTFLVRVKQGSCLMEFFHNRWRRANDVRRWDDLVNAYGGCPYVFD